MHTIEINNSDLRRATSIASKVVDKRHSMAILEHMLFEVSDGLMRVTGFNMEMRITVEVPVDSTGSAKWTMPAARIASLASTWPMKESVKIRVDGLKVRAQCGRSHAKMTAFPADDFPLLHLESVDWTIGVPSGWARLLRSVSYCMALDDTRQTLNGVSLEARSDHLKVIATNGRICAMNKLLIDGPEEPKKIIIPARSVQAIMSVLQDSPVEMVIRSSGHALVLRQGDTEVSTQLISGAYPDIDRVIPNDACGRMAPDRRDLIMALKRLHLLDGAKAVRGRAAEGGWELLGKANEEEATEWVSARAMDGEMRDFGLYPRMLASMIADAPDGEELHFEFGRDDKTPMKIVAGHYLGLLMPVIL